MSTNGATRRCVIVTCTAVSRTPQLRFSMYFPPADKYQGRFFHPVMHIAGNEKAALGRLAGLDGDSIGFAADSGGYLVESNMGAFGMAGPTQTRASAATAQFSRELAKKMYGGGRPYGYVYGGSGGGYKTIECVERTTGVWDGCVPFIHGSPTSMPNVFTVQAHALRVLKDKFPGDRRRARSRRQRRHVRRPQRRGTRSAAGSHANGYAAARMVRARAVCRSITPACSPASSAISLATIRSTSRISGRCRAISAPTHRSP